MADHHKIDNARKVLELAESATIREIKEAFRKLSLKYHPDKCGEKDKNIYEEKFKEINNAHEVLVEYCLSYRFRFGKEEGMGSDEDKQMKDHMRRFYDGWWGDLKNG